MRTALILIIAAITPSLCRAQWTQVGGGYTISSFASIGTSIFAATNGQGIYRSTDSGIRWSKTDSSPGDLAINCLAVSKKSLYAGTASGGIFLSTDEGAHWKAMNKGLPNPSGVYGSIRCMAAADSILVLGGPDGVFLSHDNGINWTPAGNAVPKIADVNSVAIEGGKIFAGTNSGVFRLIDSGSSWVAVDTGLVDGYGHSLVVLCCASRGTTLFAGTSYGVFISTNDGDCWLPTNNGVPSLQWDVRCLAIDGSTLLAGTGSGAFLSTDDGTSWVQLNSGLVGKDICSLACYGSTMLAETGCGLFVSKDRGSSWNFVRDITAPLSGLIRGVAMQGSTLYLVEDRASVRARSSWPHPSLVTLYRSTDNGDSWIPRGDISSLHVACLAADGQNLLVGTYAGLFWSSDEGDSWRTTNSTLTNQYVKAVLVVGTHVYAGTDTGGVFLSTDSGMSWMAMSNGLPRNDWDAHYQSISCLASLGANLFVGVRTGFYRSPDAGRSWTRMDPGLRTSNGDDLTITCLTTRGTSLFAGTRGYGVFLTTEEDATWKNVNEEGWPLESDYGNPVPAGVYSLAANGKFLFAGPGFSRMEAGVEGVGLWRRPLAEIVTSVRSRADDVAVTFSLRQNYPNPFNPLTTIQYDLPVAGRVTLVVYNMLGQVIDKLVDDQQNAGTQKVRWDASNMPSGIYFYRLQAEEYVETKKMILLR